jgi:uncharacterized protein YegL
MASLNMILDQNEMVENPTPRVPVSLVLDVSGSMLGAPIDELNRGVEIFFKSLRDDDVARYSAEVSVISFSNEVTQEVDFGPLEKCDIPELKAIGKTRMGGAVSLALESLEKRKELYRTLGVDYYQPWMVIMTDGKPNDDWQLAAAKTSALVDKGKLTVFPIAIGDNACTDILKEFSPARNPLRLKDLNFQEFFRWLSSSVSKVSQSIPGEKVELDLKGLEGWASL